MRELKNIPKAAAALAVINILVFFYLEWKGSTESTAFMLKSGALYAPYVLEDHEYYRLITAMFLHFGFDHLFSNMLGLIYLGSFLEDEIGSLPFLIVYLVSGLAGNIGSLFYYSAVDPYIVSAGASGAVMGLMGLIVCFVVRGGGHYKRIGTRQIVLAVIFSFCAGFTGSGINNAAHIVGFIAGFFCGLVLPFAADTGKKRHPYY